MTDDRMDFYYVWTEIDDNGREGTIAVMFDDRITPLQHRSWDIAIKFRKLAQAHRRDTGHKVRLVQYTRTQDLEILA